MLDFNLSTTLVSNVQMALSLMEQGPVKAVMQTVLFAAIKQDNAFNATPDSNLTTQLVLLVQTTHTQLTELPALPATQTALIVLPHQENARTAQQATRSMELPVMPVLTTLSPLEDLTTAQPVTLRVKPVITPMDSV